MSFLGPAKKTRTMKKSLFSVYSGIVFFLLSNVNPSLAQWESKGPYGGPIFSLKTVGNLMFAGTTNGIFKSSDNGQTWTASNKGLERVKIEAITAKGGTIFAGSGYNGVY